MKVQRKIWFLVVAVVLFLAISHLVWKRRLTAENGVVSTGTSAGDSRRDEPGTATIVYSVRRTKLEDRVYVSANRDPLIPASGKWNQTKNVSMVTSGAGLLGAAATKNDSVRTNRTLDLNVTQDMGFESVVRRHTSRDNIIIMASVDYGYVDMAINLYETSFERHGLDNYLFLASDVRVCPALEPKKIHCFDYERDKNGGVASKYDSSAFRRKTHLKTRMVLAALRLGLTVLLTDVDLVFLKNPLEHLSCKECDIQIQNDGAEPNSGFYLVRPTKPSVDLHQRAWDLGLRHKDMSNQKTLDRTLEKMVAKKEIMMKLLGGDTFPNGLDYFERGRRMFKGDNPCPQCVIIHNNWIVSGDAKAYRFKDFGLWEVDTGGYYSNPDGKYLLYDNPTVSGGPKTRTMENDALKTALVLGLMLNRSVILPEFSCEGCTGAPCRNQRKKCSLYAFFLITKFNAEMAGLYREHLFLEHHKTSEKVKGSTSVTLALHTNSTIAYTQKLSSLPPETEVFPMEKGNNSSTSFDKRLLQWLRPFHDVSILRFHNLYDLWDVIKSVSNIRGYVDKVNRALVKGSYRQYQ